MISSHYLNKCVRIIEENCYNSPSGVFAGDIWTFSAHAPKIWKHSGCYPFPARSKLIRRTESDAPAWYG